MMKNQESFSQTITEPTREWQRKLELPGLTQRKENCDGKGNGQSWALISQTNDWQRKMGWRESLRDSETLLGR